MANGNVRVPIQLVLGSQDIIERETVNAVPYNFTISPNGKWEMLIAAEDVDIKKGDIIEISTENAVIAENTVALPCAFCHHALGVVLKAKLKGLALVETSRMIDSVVFLPIRDGMIEKGDLLSVINVFPVIVEK
ncbi:MAG: DUF22 domain-containing protein [Methanosarcinales archaeon]|nr:DUF22 domain-containing protein [ANME-2 cluster archaeon]MDF1531188.1 DUF22 domain-containing protein [ANME-2 cluster archaeon]MDW7774846.1 DUF22 domain-containing protein [Methanosarcinales archaeon]